MNLNKEKGFQRCHLADGVGGQPGEQGEATLEGKWREIQNFNSQSKCSAITWAISQIKTFFLFHFKMVCLAEEN
jgi:hypothetical protein